MDPLDAPEPVALINRQEFDPIESYRRLADTAVPAVVEVEGDISGPTLAPEEELDWDDDLAEDFFTTFVPPPERAFADDDTFDEDPFDDEELFVRRRSRVPALLFAAAGTLVVGGLVLFGIATAVPTLLAGASETPAASEPIEAPRFAAPVATPPEVEAAATPVEPAVEAMVYPLAGSIEDIGPTDGEEPRRRSWKRRARRAAPKPVVPAPKPGPMRVDTLKPAVSVSALPPAQ